MNKGKKTLGYGRTRACRVCKDSKAELAEHKSKLPQYIEYMQTELRKHEAEQKAFKEASHRLGLYLIEQLLRKAQGEIPARNNVGKNAEWRKNTDIIAGNTSVEKFYEILEGLSNDEMNEVLADNSEKNWIVECSIEDAQNDIRRFREHELILEELGV